MKQSKQTSGTRGGLSLPLGLPTPQIEGVPEAIWPFIEIGMKLQSEYVELCGHRVRAWLELPENCRTCKTIDDLTAVQSGFLTKMQHDYAHFLDGILRDTMIEQDEFEEEEEKEGNEPETGTLHREAA